MLGAGRGRGGVEVQEQLRVIVWRRRRSRAAHKQTFPLRLEKHLAFCPEHTLQKKKRL